MSSRAPSLSLPLRVLRALSVVTVEPPRDEDAFVAGSDFAAAESVPVPYDPNRAASALVANPWYWRAVAIRASKLAALDLQVQRQTAEGWEPIEGHPLADLLAKPNTSQTALQFRVQIATDLFPGGNAYVIPAGWTTPGQAPAALLLLEPGRVTITPGQDGSPLAYVYDQQGVTVNYDPDTVGHIRYAAAGTGMARLYGTGEVQPMDRDIAADVALAAQMAKKSARGRPDAAYVPRDPKTTWGRPQVRDMQTQMDRILREQTGGVAVMSGAGQFEQIDWTISDLGGIEAREYARSVVVAVTGVPPTLLGLQSANYATAEMERKTFITDTLAPLASLLDDAFTDLARRLGFPDVRIKHVIPETDDGRAERLARVQVHIANNMSPADAYAYEGFDDAPELAGFGVAVDAEGAPEPEPEDEDAPDDETRTDITVQAQALRAMLVDADPDDEDDIRSEVSVLLDMLPSVLG